MKRRFSISLQFFGDDPEPAPDGGQTLSDVVAAYEAKLKAVQGERDKAIAEVLEHKKAISLILNGRTSAPPDAPDAAKFAKSCKF